MSDSCRVALVAPPFPGRFDGMPMNLLYLAGALRNAGHVVTVHDFARSDATTKELAEAVAATRPDVIGITGTSPSHLEAMALAEALRRQLPSVSLVKGGYHERCGRALDACRHVTDGMSTLDYVVASSAGEMAIVAVADAAAAGSVPVSVPGLHAVIPGDVPEEHIVVPPPEILPARDLLPRDREYHYGGIFGDRRAAQLMTHRGCRFKCSFCAISALEFANDLTIIERDLDQIQALGYSAVFIDDGTFTVDWERAKPVAESLRRRGMIWACQTRADVVKRDQLKLMAQTGCVYVYYGLESGSQRVLKSIAKGLQVDRVAEAVNETRKNGMNAVTSFLFGAPLEGGHDDESDWKASVDLMRMAQPSAVVPSIFAYYPGSPAWRTLDSGTPMQGYVEGVNRDAEIWRWFDDGFGAVHAVDEQVAADIRGFLEQNVSDLLAAH